jgi:hypothetical protein
MESDFSRLNSGIAMVTPITDALPLLGKEPFVEYGRRFDDAWDVERSTKASEREDVATPPEV